MQRVGNEADYLFMIYAKKALRDRKIPFEIEAPDSFYCESNMRNIKESLKQIREGKVLGKTMEELETMEIMGSMEHE